MEFVDKSPNRFGVVPLDMQSSGVAMATSVFQRTSPVKRSKHRKLKENSASHSAKIQDIKRTPNDILRASGVFTSIPIPHVPLTVPVPEQDEEVDTVFTRATGCETEPSTNHAVESPRDDDEQFLRGIFDNSYMKDKSVRNRLSKATLEKLCSPKGNPGPGERFTRSPPGSAHHPRAWKGGMCYFPKPPPSSSSSKSKDTNRRRKPATAPTCTVPGAPRAHPKGTNSTSTDTGSSQLLAPPLVDRYADFDTPVTATNIVPLEELSRSSLVPAAPPDLSKKPSPRAPILKKEGVARRPSSTTGERVVKIVTPGSSPVTTHKKANTTADTGTIAEQTSLGGDVMLSCVQCVSESMVHAALTDALKNLLTPGSAAGDSADVSLVFSPDPVASKGYSEKAQQTETADLDDSMDMSLLLSPDPPKKPTVEFYR